MRSSYLLTLATATRSMALTIGFRQAGIAEEDCALANEVLLKSIAGLSSIE